MCAGLPVVITKEVGCAKDLVIHGVNGYHHEVGDVAAIAAALARLLQDDGLRDEMGRKSCERIANWSFAECLNGIRAAMRGLKCARTEAACSRI
jgi:glycosyltransferase involved in cell wall biosynthesis